METGQGYPAPVSWVIQNQSACVWIIEAKTDLGASWAILIDTLSHWILAGSFLHDLMLCCLYFCNFCLCTPENNNMVLEVLWSHNWGWYQEAEQVSGSTGLAFCVPVTGAVVEMQGQWLQHSLPNGPCTSGDHSNWPNKEYGWHFLVSWQLGYLNHL